MVSLPKLSSYTSQQLEQARQTSPAFARYETLILSLEIDEVHKVRHTAWLECVAATYFQTASTEVICAYWSQVADQLLKQVWCESGLDQTHSLLVALGKHGAEELNLSSDIDVMIVANDQDKTAIEKGLRIFRQRLHEPGEFGFCYRLDFDLRPGGTMGPVVTSPSQFQDYYWSQGETWERLALVRLRPIVGDELLKNQITDLARRFSFRKFLDFTLLDDLKALRSKVHKNGFERRDHELHIKLDVGGIRDIELFVHSLLVMNGGKVLELQTRSTTRALELLKAKGMIDPDDGQYLLDSYWHFRHCENTVQALDDRQTHVILDVKIQSELMERMQRVSQIVSSLLGQLDLSQVHLPVEMPAQKKWLLDLGFGPVVVENTWEPLMKATALSHKNDRDERARQEFLFSFVSELARHQGLDRDLGLNLLLDFVKATRGKATFFSMLLRTPRLIEDLARLFCLSPYLGSILAARPELLDHFILRVDEAFSPDPQVLLQQMSERKLLTEIWSANQLLKDGSLKSLFERITSTADEISLELLRHLKSEFPNSLLEIVALGKWGGRELGLRSDLDFIFVTKDAPQEDDFKVARRFISRLTDPLKRGNLYDVDLRLRPSGQSGPLLVNIRRLHEYWQQNAQPWERQAYLRARLLTAPAEGSKTLLVKSNLLEKPLTSEDLEELKRIRLRLLKPFSPVGVDLKYAPGGLIDVEFVVQTALLAARLEPEATSTLSMMAQLKWPIRLQEVYQNLRRYEQMLQLASAHKLNLITIESPPFIKASALLSLSPEAAWQELTQLLREAREILNPLDPTGLRY